MWTDPKRLRAAPMLVLANACWALSFPTMKALNFLQGPLLPGSSSWFIASMTLSIRFGLAAVIMLFFCAKTLRQMTALEMWEGLGLGVFACAGLIFQMDGLAYTSASTSASSRNSTVCSSRSSWRLTNGAGRRVGSSSAA